MANVRFQLNIVIFITMFQLKKNVSNERNMLTLCQCFQNRNEYYYIK
jgi:hypothetical protein